MRSPKENKDTLILLVDDDSDLLEILSFTLKRAGYQVLTANNGRSALTLIEYHPVDVVITDCRMPGGDGIELLEQAKSRWPVTPVILMMSGFMDVSAEEARRRGAKTIFAKPFDRKVLLDAIQSALIAVA